MNKLFLVSLVTLGIISSFVFVIMLLILQYLDIVDVWFAIGMTILFNTLMFFISPKITDWTSKFFYKAEYIDNEKLEQSHPEISKLINKISQENKFKAPKFFIIPDQNPTAYSYGSTRGNARVVVTQGLFTFLNTSEQEAVIAHEMGHVVNRDFLVMMIATTLVQILYEVYASFSKLKGKESSRLRAIGWLAFVFYQISIYVLMYLSRTREYMADKFSSEHTNPRNLADALIKIGYGIAKTEDGESSKRLLEATRHLGITDPKNSSNVGRVSYITHEDPKMVSDVIVFDCVNPWAYLMELSSTHPLTGKRIDKLEDYARGRGEAFHFDVDAAKERMNISYSRLYKSFFLDLFISILPVISIIPIFFVENQITGFILAPLFGIAVIVRILYKYPINSAKQSTILDEMRNPYASPVRGVPIALVAKPIGRGMPGYIFDENLMCQDVSGVIYSKYNHPLGFFGNLFFALKKIKKLFGRTARINGWFFRGMTPWLELKRLDFDTGETVKSYPRLWTLIFGIFFVLTSVLIAVLLIIKTT